MFSHCLFVVDVGTAVSICSEEQVLTVAHSRLDVVVGNADS
jgi:hypothetical protein